MFDHEVPVVISAMRDLTVGVFEHLEITSTMDVGKRLAYTQRILIGAALKIPRGSSDMYTVGKGYHG